MRPPVLLLLILSTFLFHSSECSRVKRQLSIDDIISRALSLVRPLFDTSQPLQNDAMLTKQSDPSPDDLRDSSILGSHHASPLDDLPLCKGNSRICQFISCSAENFKKDPAFGNIQLAAQVLGDAKLRRAISSNPEAIDAVCKEQGMDESQCKLFSKGFQLIDKFITTIEKPEEKTASASRATSVEVDPTTPQDDEPIPIPVKRDNELDDDYDILPPASASSPAHKTMGSKTWSSQPEGGPQLLEVRNDLVASLTPPPFWTFPPLATFAPPTPPPGPPLAFPTVPSLILPPFKMPLLDKNFFFPADKYSFGPPSKTFRLKREVEEEDHSMREKRDADYYDELTTKDADKKDFESSPAPSTGSDDYYGDVEEAVSRPSPKKESALKNCVNMLGLEP